jgi:uncharacterized protein YbaR (Trm112 family)
MIDRELLKILCCPETHQPVTPADEKMVAKLNDMIASGQLKNRAGQPVTGRIDGALMRSDGCYLYPIRDEIPVMLVDEAIAVPFT